MKSALVSLALLGIGYLCPTIAHAAGAPSVLDGLHKVASNNCGNSLTQPYVLMGGDWTYPVSVIPETIIGKDDPARTVAFGQAVTLSFEGLNPAAVYVLDMSFLSDDAARAQSIRAGNVTLEERLTLPRAETVRRTYALDPAVYAAGKLQVTVTCLAGPNAVVSSVDVYSNDPLLLKPTELSTDGFSDGIGLPPSSVDGEGHSTDAMSLNGVWKFNPAPVGPFWQEPLDTTAWSDIAVPGEWVMQGFEVAPNTAAAYVRTFDVPKDWTGKQAKLRFDAVFSRTVIYLNGVEVGRHRGGFTPFVLDVTQAITCGSSNTLAMAVTSESLEDRLASASQYAVHPLGGISRKVTLFAVSRLHVVSFHVTTAFDAAFDDATMTVSMKLSNQGAVDLEGATLVFSLLRWPTRAVVQRDAARTVLPTLAAGDMLERTVEIPADSPDTWDSEHPNLYVLQCALRRGPETVQTVERRFGFRQVEARGNQVFVNGMPVKLRGSDRHEVHPLRGRSLTMAEWRRDAELFREANCNLIRTSHYPPAEEFIGMCDELGLFVELEAPICWVRGLEGGDYAEGTKAICRQMLEAVERDRSHPSIIIWSLGNESTWSRCFQMSHDVARKADPSRLFTFHDQAAAGSSMVDVVNFHYPGPNGARNFADRDAPVWFGEYCHLNAYNRYELWTDPGLRDAWGRGFKAMWDTMYATPAILGGAIWSGIDDTFHLPSGHTIGYGTWGPIDGWRRRKPEYWHVKKTYSPVRISAAYITPPAAGTTLRIPLENRHNFTNVSELSIHWEIGEEEGQATADIAPRTSGELIIRPTSAVLKGQTAFLRFTSPLGFVVDEVRLPIGEPSPLKRPEAAASTTGIDVISDDKQITITTAGLAVRFDRQAGMIAEASREGETLVKAGPELMILPLNGAGDAQMTEQMKPISPDTAVRAGRNVEHVEITRSDNAAAIAVMDTYDIAKGGFKLTVTAGGTMVLDYEYELTADINPRQVGMVLSTPRSCSRLSWARKGLWTVYPSDHIGRLEGVTEAFVGAELSGPAGPVSNPDYSWKNDTNEMGCNDFRSTKEAIIWARLSGSGSQGLVVESAGSQHVRCWIEGDSTRLLIADYSNSGAERFFRGHAAVEDKPLKAGDKIRGSITFALRRE